MTHRRGSGRRCKHDPIGKRRSLPSCPSSVRLWHPDSSGWREKALRKRKRLGTENVLQRQLQLVVLERMRHRRRRAFELAVITSIRANGTRRHSPWSTRWVMGLICTWMFQTTELDPGSGFSPLLEIPSPQEQFARPYDGTLQAIGNPPPFPFFFFFFLLTCSFPARVEEKTLTAGRLTDWRLKFTANLAEEGSIISDVASAWAPTAFCDNLGNRHL